MSDDSDFSRQSTEEEYWQLCGAGAADAVTDLYAYNSTSNTNNHAFYNGDTGEVTLYYSKRSTSGIWSAKQASSSDYFYFELTGRGMYDPDPDFYHDMGTSHAVPYEFASSAQGVRLYFEMADNSAYKTSRIYYLDGQNAAFPYEGQDFNSGAGEVCTPSDYGVGGNCEPTLALDPLSYTNVKHFRQFKIGYPDLTSWVWTDTAYMSFMFVTVDLETSACPDGGAGSMTQTYAVWDGSNWGLQMDSSGCPIRFNNMQAPSPLHLGGNRYKLYYSSHDATQNYIGAKRIIYSNASSATEAPNADEWESTADARDVHFVWPSGNLVNGAVVEESLDDYHVIHPTGTADTVIMYTAASDPSTSTPVKGTWATLINP